MELVISTEKKPIKLWLNDIEEGALNQAKNLANLPFVFKHIAIMPDAHQGFGMPIGGVMATMGIVVPNAVGVDIGCGVCAIKTSLHEIGITDLKNIMKRIRSVVPVGFKHHQINQDERLMPSLPYGDKKYGSGIIKREYNNALKQLGTLGGGNHFIEIQKGDDNHIWIMIHSGSRNLGFKVANYYNDLAIFKNNLWFSSVPKEHDLAYLPTQTNWASRYFDEMEYCVEFAYLNRDLMVDRIMLIFYETIKNVEFEDKINIAHNYAQFEHHFGKNVLVHRKGATMAKKGQLGIIPGSQGSNSYIVKGLGNPESFQSCSHGAGRRISRNQARRELNFEVEKKRLDDLGIIHSIRNTKDLDEAPGAYKDISKVMENQKDLVESIVELHPLAVIKG